MSTIVKILLIPLFVLCVTSYSLTISSDESTLAQDLSRYFMELDESFSNIVDAGALRSANFNQADRIFIREMRKKQQFYAFIRTNVKGIVISEVVRGEKVERPMNDVQNEQWFSHTHEKKEPYYSIVKDENLGRHFLFWARPILKQGDLYVGSVLLKIDLWDSFNEFSTTIHAPFLIKLANENFFSHRWSSAKSGTEELLTISGIDSISITYNTTKKVHSATTTTAINDTLSEPVLAGADTSQKRPADNPPRKITTGIITPVVIFLAIIVTVTLVILRMRKKTFSRRMNTGNSIKI